MPTPLPFPERVSGSASKAVRDTVLLAVKVASDEPDSVIVVFDHRFDIDDQPLMCRVAGYTDSFGSQAFDIKWMPPEYAPVDGSVLTYAAIRAWVGVQRGEELSLEPGR